MEPIKFNAYEGTDTGKKRNANEDCFGHMALGDIGHLFIVCDGMGGHVGGAEASRTAVSCIKEYFATHELKKVPELSINEAIEFANTQIFYKSSVDSAFAGMGTTCVVVLLMNDGKAYYAHVGDSRIYLYSNGKLHKLTKDHSFVQTLVDIGQLKEEEMESHPRKNQITRALGIDERVEPDMPSNPAKLAKGDMLLLCTDGLNGMISDELILNHLKSCVGINPVPDLIKMALDAGGKDNVTATVLQVTSSPEAKTYFELPAKPTGTGVPTRTISDVPLNDNASIGKLSSKKLLVMASVVLLLIMSSAAIWWFTNNDAPNPTEGNSVSSTESDSEFQIDSIHRMTTPNGAESSGAVTTNKTDQANTKKDTPLTSISIPSENTDQLNTTGGDQPKLDVKADDSKVEAPVESSPKINNPKQAEIDKLEEANKVHQNNIERVEKDNQKFLAEQNKCKKVDVFCKKKWDDKIKANNVYITNRRKDIKTNNKKIEELKNQN